MKYAELHCHQEQGSILDGSSTSEDYCIRAKELGIEALAITDHSSLAGIRNHFDTCVKYDIKAICGVEAHLATGSRHEKISAGKRQDGEDSNAYYHLILLAKNNNGLKNLYAMEREAWVSGFYGKPRIDMDLLDDYGSDIIVTSACVSGPIARNLINQEEERAMEWFHNLHDRFADDFYMELQDHNEGISPGLNQRLLDIADKYNVKSIATRDCHHADPEKLWLQESVLILNTNPKKNKDLDLSAMPTGELLDKFNYLYPDRKMTFEQAEVCLMDAQYTYNKFLEQNIDRPDLITNTIEVSDKIGG